MTRIKVVFPAPSGPTRPRHFPTPDLNINLIQCWNLAFRESFHQTADRHQRFGVRSDPLHSRHPLSSTCLPSKPNLLPRHSHRLRGVTSTSIAVLIGKVECQWIGLQVIFRAPLAPGDASSHLAQAAARSPAIAAASP